MSKYLVGVSLLAAFLMACSSDPLSPDSGPSAELAETGRLELPLTANVGTVTYRLTLAQFTISGAPLGKKTRIVKPPADEPVHTETLPKGSYSVLLENGWALEKTDASGTFKPITAKLVTPNPVLIDIETDVVKNAWFIFATGQGDVTLGQGDVNLRIGVQDCSAYDTYTATLATQTVDCLGTIGPDLYSVSKDGVLRRNFDACPRDKTRLRPIDSLLTLQFRGGRLPFVKECMVDRFAEWQAKFAAAGAVTCPEWKKERVVNPITEAVIAKVTPALPQLPAEDNGEPLQVLSELKVNDLYTVGFTSTPPRQRCESAAACAELCAGGFPGFVLRSDGETVLTDPPAWLLDIEYPSSGADPFLRLGYYHPMSYYGGAPGTVFADARRAAPCPNCAPETCSYFAGIHVKYPLQLDCLDPADFSTCVSFCAPPEP